MFVLKYMWSFFVDTEDTPESVLSLDDAYAIVKPNKPARDLAEKRPAPDLVIQNYETCTKIGKITQIIHNSFTIEHVFTFVSDRTDLRIGSKVSYQLINSLGHLEVSHVELIENDWDTVDTRKRNWCERTVVCEVVRRQGRILALEPGHIEINLNEIASEFLPVSGDWVELDVKSELDENVDDLSGKILQINKLRPARTQIISGTITNWDTDCKLGTINKTVSFTFDQDSLYSGCAPSKGEHVTVECIESTRQNCNWRALKIVPTYLNRTKKSGRKIIIPNDLKDDVPDVNITNNICVNFDQVGHKRQFEVTIQNNGATNLKLMKAEFPKPNGQCRLSTDVKYTVIKAKEKFLVFCNCEAKSVGEVNEILILHFDDVKIKRLIKIIVGGIQSAGQRFSNNNRYSNKRFIVEEDRRTLVRGQRAYNSPRFLAQKMPDYSVPNSLLKLFEQYESSGKRKEEVIKMIPDLTKTLSYFNYEEKFHHLIFLEEIQTLLAMMSYEQEKACFIKSGEYLLLEIENLAERRPSIIMGDRIIARDIYDSTKPDHEGIIHKVGQQHVFLKFSQAFHNSYDGEDYSIKAIAGRTSFRREHHGVASAIKNLGKSILFPSQVIESDPQIDFAADCDFDTENSANGDLIEEVKYNCTNKNDIINKIEWYNKTLNYFQKEAVINCLLGVCRPLPYIIFGPPGTGKTVTVVELVLQIVRRIPHSRILLTAPSNSAADLLALRLIDSGILKPGDLVRLVSMTAASSIPSKLAPYAATGNLEKEGTETNESFLRNNGLTQGCNSASLGRHRITVSTCSSAGLLYGMGFRVGHFSHIIVDEAGQTSEPSVMIPLALMDKLSGQAILAGDPKQLGPITLSNYTSEFGLDESYLERMINRFPYVRDIEGFPKTSGYDPRLITKLLLNYRALPVLLKLPSELFYNNDLIPTISDRDSEEALLLERVGDVLPMTRDDRASAIIFHGCTGDNYQTEDSPSWYNPDEAAYVYYYLNLLYGKGLNARDVGIITPYKAQTKQLMDLCKEAEFDIPKIGTVEDFQGQEFNVILLSTVRSAQNFVKTEQLYNMGFVSNPRRLNVAITRAKSLLIIVGNPHLLSGNKFWKAVIQYCMEHGCYTGCTFNLT